MALSARPMSIPSRDAQLPPPAVREGAETRGDREKKHHLGAVAPLFVVPAPSHHPRTDRRRRCCRFASRTTARATYRDATVSTQKTERRARDAREKTSAWPPLATVRC